MRQKTKRGGGAGGKQVLERNVGQQESEGGRREEEGAHEEATEGEQPHRKVEDIRKVSGRSVASTQLAPQAESPWVADQKALSRRFYANLEQTRQREAKTPAGGGCRSRVGSSQQEDDGGDGTVSPRTEASSRLSAQSQHRHTPNSGAGSRTAFFRKPWCECWPQGAWTPSPPDPYGGISPLAAPHSSESLTERCDRTTSWTAADDANFRAFMAVYKQMSGTSKHFGIEEQLRRPRFAAAVATPTAAEPTAEIRPADGQWRHMTPGKAAFFSPRNPWLLPHIGAAQPVETSISKLRSLS